MIDEDYSFSEFMSELSEERGSEFDFPEEQTYHNSFMEKFFTSVEQFAEATE